MLCFKKGGDVHEKIFHHAGSQNNPQGLSDAEK